MVVDVPDDVKRTLLGIQKTSVGKRLNNGSIKPTATLLMLPPTLTMKWMRICQPTG